MAFSERKVIVSMNHADYKHQLLNIYSWLKDFMIRQQKHTLKLALLSGTVMALSRQTQCKLVTINLLLPHMLVILRKQNKNSRTNKYFHHRPNSWYRPICGPLDLEISVSKTRRLIKETGSKEYQMHYRHVKIIFERRFCSA